MRSTILTLENFKDAYTKFRNQIKVTYSHGTQAAPLKVNKKTSKPSAILAQIFTKTLGLEKFGQ